jgi:hypothetical protein
MIRLFVIYLSYLNTDNLLQIKFAKKFAELKKKHTIVKATNVLYNV